MIKRISVRYFQNHIKTDLHLSEGVNVFIGSSNQGKSVIRKAVNWVKNNKPSGISFKNRKNKSKTTKVEIETPEGIVERVRGKSTNYYKVKGVKFKAIGQKVPKEVSDLLNMEDVNIQNQFDNFFLLQDSPGTVAKKFNDFVGLSLIDTTSKEAEKNVRQYNQEVLSLNSEIKSIENKLKDFSNLPLIKSLLKDGEELEKKIEKIDGNIESVSNLSNDLQTLLEELKEVSKYKEIKKLFDKAVNLYNKVDSVQEGCDVVEELIGNYSQLEKEKKPLLNVGKASKLLQNATVLQKTIVTLSDAVSEVNDSLIRHEELSSDLTQSSHEYKQLQNKLQEMHNKIDFCPLCKKKWR